MSPDRPPAPPPPPSRRRPLRPPRRRGLVTAAVFVFATLAALALPSFADAGPYSAQASRTRHEAGAQRAHAKAVQARPAPSRARGAARAHARAVHARPSSSRAGGAPRAHAKAKAKAPHAAVRQVGMASYYARRFAGRRMADGTPMRPESDNAASPTLPLGSMARVTNLQNGRSAVVTIRDRGPHVRGRIIDLSPGTARQLDFLRAGVARVEVTPLTATRSGAGAASAAVAALSASGARAGAVDPS